MYCGLFTNCSNCRLPMCQISMACFFFQRPHGPHFRFQHAPSNSSMYSSCTSATCTWKQCMKITYDKICQSTKWFIGAISFFRSISYNLICIQKLPHTFWSPSFCDHQGTQLHKLNSVGIFTNAKLIFSGCEADQLFQVLTAYVLIASVGNVLLGPSSHIPHLP